MFIQSSSVQKLHKCRSVDLAETSANEVNGVLRGINFKLQIQSERT
jgi:hypothetical protein